MSGLPEGLITNTDVITGDIQQVDRVDSEDIAQLWRVYSANRRLLANNTGKRLENLFWRIWSNDRLKINIRGSRIAVLFHGISEDDSVIRTTPTQSPRRDSSLPSALGDFELLISVEEKQARFLELSEPRPQSRSTPTVTDGRQLQAVESSATSFTEKRRVTAQGTRPPPILKKACRDSSNQLAKTARILTPTWKTQSRQLPEEVGNDESAIVSPSIASEPEPSTNSPIPQRVIDETLYNDEGEPPSKLSTGRERSPATGNKPGEVSLSAKSKSKKSTFIASTASSKRRPQMSRRKSSNSSGPPSKATVPSPASRLSHPDVAPTRSITPKSAMPSPKVIQESAPMPPLSLRVDSTSHRPAHFERPLSLSSRSTSPVLSRPAGEHVMKATRDDGSAGTQSWLVDVDFKAKFANKVRQYAGAQSSSTTRASRQSRPGTKAKGKSAMMLGVENEEEAEEDVRGSASAIQSSEDEDDEGESVTAEPAAFQKTKSQLTLLLETERRRERERERREKTGKGRA